jgi:hypothetical protein
MTTLRESFATMPEGIVGKPRVIDNNTFEYKLQDGTFVRRLHHTDIATVRPDNRVRITSGGWKTPTTKGRLNDVLQKMGYSVYSGTGLWYVRSLNPLPPALHGKGDIPFYDNMVLPDAFANPKKAEKIGEAQKKLKADIKRFVERTIVDGQPLPEPGAGDCWYCLMFDREEPRTLEFNSFKDKKPHRDSEHLRQHVKSNYMHGSLIVNACRANGMQDAGIGYWTGWGGRLPEDYKRLRQIVRRYLGKRLGLAV